MSSPMPLIPPSDEGALCVLCFGWVPFTDLFVDSTGIRWDAHDECARKDGWDD